MTRIAIDAMGGDHAPDEIVKGALWAASDYDVPIELVGKEDEIQRVINDVKQNGIRTNNINGDATIIPNRRIFFFIRTCNRFY